MNQKQIEAAAIMMRIFLTGLALNFDADFHELEEITKRALLEVESGASLMKGLKINPCGNSLAVIVV